MQEVTDILKQSIQFSLDHRSEAVEYALQFGRDLDKNLADKFVGMYVNDWTLDYGPRGREAISTLLKQGNRGGPGAGGGANRNRSTVRNYDVALLIVSVLLYRLGNSDPRSLVRERERITSGQRTWIGWREGEVKVFFSRCCLRLRFFPPLSQPESCSMCRALTAASFCSIFS